MNLTKNGLTIEVPDAVVVNLVLERLAGNSPVIAPPSQATPHLGEYWQGQGGIFVGTVLGIDGGRDYHLILGPECDDELDHSDATQYAVGLEVDGHKDFTLPNRREQRFLFCNGHGHFKPMFYWSCEQRPATPGCAFGQRFADGAQFVAGKSLKYPVRTVRRIYLTIR